MRSTMSEEGMLKIEAPRLEPPVGVKRQIPIQMAEPEPKRKLAEDTPKTPAKGVTMENENMATKDKAKAKAKAA